MAELLIPTMKTISETSKITGLATYRIRQLVSENKIVYLKAGKKILVNIEKLIEYLNSSNENNVIKEGV